MRKGRFKRFEEGEDEFPRRDPGAGFVFVLVVWGSIVGVAILKELTR